jgi:hypothetical protein
MSNRPDCTDCVRRYGPADHLPHWDTAERHRGWHSRRYPTRANQDEARLRYLETHATARGPAAKALRARQGAAT